MPPIIGGTPSRDKPYYWDGENPWVKISDMTDKFISATEENISDEGISESSVKLLEAGTLLFSFKLTIGESGFFWFPLVYQ